MQTEQLDYAIKIQPAESGWSWALIDAGGQIAVTGNSMTSQGAIEQAIATAKALSA